MSVQRSGSCCTSVDVCSDSGCTSSCVCGISGEDFAKEERNSVALNDDCSENQVELKQNCNVQLLFTTM